MSQYNVEVMRDLVKFLRATPQAHDQGLWVYFEEGPSIHTLGQFLSVPDEDWFVGRLAPADQLVSCGTTACFAGWTVIRHCTDQVLLEGNDLVGCVPRGAQINADLFENLVTVEDRAQQILGLGDHEAEILFSATNSLDEIVACLEEWTGEQFT